MSAGGPELATRTATEGGLFERHCSFVVRGSTRGALEGRRRGRCVHPGSVQTISFIHKLKSTHIWNDKLMLQYSAQSMNTFRKFLFEALAYRSINRSGCLFDLLNAWDKFWPDIPRTNGTIWTHGTSFGWTSLVRTRRPCAVKRHVQTDNSYMDSDMGLQKLLFSRQN